MLITNAIVRKENRFVAEEHAQYSNSSNTKEPINYIYCISLEWLHYATFGKELAVGLWLT